jgi:hypothetical protein
LRRLVLESFTFGESLRSLLSIPLRGKLADLARAHVLADDAAVHFAAAGVVAALSPAGLPAHGVV